MTFHFFSMTPLPAKFSWRRRHFSTARPHISRVSSLVTQVDRSLPRVARYNIRVLESWKPVGIIEFIRLVFIILPSSLDCRVVPWHFGLQRRKYLSLLFTILPSFSFSEESLGFLPCSFCCALYLSSSSVCVIANGISISICSEF